MFCFHASGPESSMMLYFEEVYQPAVPVGCQTTREFGQVRQNATRGQSLLSTIALYQFVVG